MKVNLTAPKIYLVIGRKTHLLTKQNLDKITREDEKEFLQSEFQRLRRSLKNIEIITYDELLDQIIGLHKLLSENM